MRVMYGGDICLLLCVSHTPLARWTHENDLKGSNIDGWPRLRGETGESERAGNGKAMVLQFELLNKVVKWMRSPSAVCSLPVGISPRKSVRPLQLTVDVGH